MVVLRTSPRLTRQYTVYFYTLFVLVLFGLTACAILFFWPFHVEEKNQTFVIKMLESAPEKSIDRQMPTAGKRNKDCNFFSCLDVYKCGQQKNAISVYIYPLYRYVDEDGLPISVPMSQEFKEILEALQRSPYYTSDPTNACLFVPSLDLLNQNNLRLKETSQVLAALPYWNEGSNHVLFNFLPGSSPDYNTALEVDTEKGLVAGAGFCEWSYRRGLDVSIPLYSPFSRERLTPSSFSPRPWLVVSSQTNIHQEYIHELEVLALEHPELLVLGPCLVAGRHASSYQYYNSTERCHSSSVYAYPQVLQNATFCLVIRGARLAQLVLSDALMSGCIPVIVADTYVLPFSEVIDWKRAAIVLYEDNLLELMNVLRSVSEERVQEMQSQGLYLWKRYFSSIPNITHTFLEIMNDRIFRHNARDHSYWNDPPSQTIVEDTSLKKQPPPIVIVWFQFPLPPPLFLPALASKSQGFTAVILTYDRVESLFKVIQRVVQAPSLAKVVVVWNNQKKSPPPLSSWPKIGKPLKIVKTKKNQLSNRFYPYDEIETEAVLAIDDDIVMLTADELEFGFEVWHEFPDRIVGFPSRVHLWDNSTARWKYESEWTNEISMVLTGAAFYHKYYNYLYTTSMPGDIKSWVDEHMNCEDIAMNFLVANVTGKAPIKVTPRKKFKCPECTNVEMLSADVVHMAERTDCINRFAQVYGKMPLKTVEFRADPVLFKDNFPEKLKRFNNVGSL